MRQELREHMQQEDTLGLHFFDAVMQVKHFLGFNFCENDLYPYGSVYHLNNL